MGAIFKQGRLTAGKNEVEKVFQNLIDDDNNTRRTDDDMYRGDFGSTHTIKCVDTFKGKSESVRDKHADAFIDSHDFVKYEIHYAIVGHLGYEAHKAIPVMHVKGLRGPFYIGTQTFKNITEIKQVLKSPVKAQSLHGQHIKTFSPNLQSVGYIGSDSRTYKTKPKSLPKKYQWLDEVVDVAYGALNPY